MGGGVVGGDLGRGGRRVADLGADRAGSVGREGG